jgi:hypothetical protein
VFLPVTADSAMNVDLLEAVRHAIRTHPDRFCAAQWAFARNARAVLRHGAAPEGFRCCIAGHVLLETGRAEERALLREGGFHTGGGLWTQAAEALALTEVQGRELFFPSQWDRPHKQAYYLCTQEDEADVATAYIDYFLVKHGRSAESPFELEHDSDRIERAAREGEGLASKPLSAVDER